MARSIIRRDLLREGGEITEAVRRDQGAGEDGKPTKM
jgi:hypothetical protein